MSTPSDQSPRAGDKRCDECADLLDEPFVSLPDFGDFHAECVDRCPDGIDWPSSLVRSGDVRYVCAGCARGEAA